MPSPIKIRLMDAVVAYAAHLHPEHRRALKAALRELSNGRGEVKILERELDGFERLRVGRYRVIFRRRANMIDCVFMETRDIIYEVFRARPDLWD